MMPGGNSSGRGSFGRKRTREGGIAKVPKPPFVCGAKCAHKKNFGREPERHRPAANRFGNLAAFGAGLVVHRDHEGFANRSSS